MGKKVIDIPNAPKLPFSPAIKAGDYIFVSGQVGLVDADGKKLETVEAQTKQCLENIKKILAVAGSSLADVVKVTVFLSRLDDFAKMNEAYQGYFQKDFPARTTAIAGLVHPRILVEIECVAYCLSR